MIIGKAITAGGSGGIKCKLNITTSPGAAVTATLGEKVVEAVADENGIAILILNKKGIWTVTATLDGTTITKEIDTSFSIEKNLSFFPAEPSSYEYMALITSSQIWTAPEDGYFQIEVFGASGKGGNCASKMYIISNSVYQGGGGGGGGYACSRIKLKKGDTISIVQGAVGATSSATINSSVESYSQMEVTSGGNGEAGVSGDVSEAGDGGSGGSASGGNYANKNGGNGTKGKLYSSFKVGTSYTIPPGGSSGHSEGNIGGDGGYGYYEGTTLATFTKKSGGAGKAGFIKIYRGNTNVVA